MKIILFVFAITSCLFSPAFASKDIQNPYRDVALSKMQIEPGRAEEIKKLLIESSEKRREIMAAARREVSDFQAETYKKIASILTEEELQAYDSKINAQQQVFMKAMYWNKSAPVHLPQGTAGDMHASNY